MIAKLQSCLDCHRPAKADGDRCEQCEKERAERERLKGPTLGPRQPRHTSGKYGLTYTRHGGIGHE